MTAIRTDDKFIKNISSATTDHTKSILLDTDFDLNIPFKGKITKFINTKPEEIKKPKEKWFKQFDKDKWRNR